MKVVKSSCAGKKKVRTCTFKPQVNIKNKREPIQTQEDVNAAHSEAKIQDLIEDLKNVIWTKVSHVATSDSFGFDEGEVNDYFFVDVTPTEIGEDHHEAIRVEVRAEVSYEGLEELMDALNPIIESYDSYAYFEPVDPGIIEAYVSVDQVDMSVYGSEDEVVASDNSEYTNRYVTKYKNKSYTVYDNSNSANLSQDADIEALQKWKAQVTQQAGAYNDADRDYQWAKIENGVIYYYRNGKLEDKSYYMSPSDWDIEQLSEWSEAVINEAIENLYEANKNVPDRMIHNSTSIEATDSYNLDDETYEYVTNVDGYWVYRAVVNGKGLWRAMPQGSDESQFEELSFPISYAQARGFEPINEPTAIMKLRKDLGKKLLPKAGQSVEATTEYLDIGGILGEPNARYSSEDLRSIYEEEKHHDPLIYIYEKGKHHDPLISQYDSYESWFKDIEQYLYEIYSDTEDITSSTDDKVFIEDILDGLEDNGYDLNDLPSIKEGLWALFGYQGKDANDVIEDLVAGGFIDSNVLIDSGHKSIYSDIEYDEEYDEERAEDNPWVQQIAYTMSSEMPPWFTVQGDNLEYDVTYNGQTVHVEFFLFEGAKYTYYIDGDGPYTTNQSEEIEQDIEDYIDEQQEDITSATEEDGEDLPMVDQEYDSAATSINSNKLPAIYKMVSFNPGDVIVDFGGGKFDNAVEYIKDKGATLVVYDPYNRSAEHNREVLKILRENGGADAAVNSNVLNVIKEPEARKNVLENIARITKPGAPIYITVYEGKGDGQEGPTKSGYQLNRKTADYLEEIQEVFPDATRRGKLITAHNSGAITSSWYDLEIIDRYDKDVVDYQLIARKQVDDNDGFSTDYAVYVVYLDDGSVEYECYHGDSDLYGPWNGEGLDFESENDDEAVEWYNNYASDEIESSESIEADAFSSLEDQYLSPPEYDDPIEHEDSEELVEVELNQIITVDVDGDYEWDDDTYVWASPDESNEEWRSEDGVYIDDKVGVVEHIDDLIIPNVPTRPGRYRVTGLAKLVYDVSGIQEYRTEYGPDDYDSDIDIDHAVVSFNFRKSEVRNLKITPVRR